MSAFGGKADIGTSLNLVTAYPRQSGQLRNSLATRCSVFAGWGMLPGTPNCVMSAFETKSTFGSLNFALTTGGFNVYPVRRPSDLA